MCYKLALASALGLEPDLLLLDEPFGPIDSDSAAVLVEELVAAAQRGGAVLLSGHQMPAGFAPTRYLELAGGRLREVEAPALEDES